MVDEARMNAGVSGDSSNCPQGPANSLPMVGPAQAEASASATGAPGQGVVVAGGGTAGHVFPAIAFARGLLARYGDIRVTFFGGADGPESALAQQAGFSFQPIPAAPFHGVGTLARLAALSRLAGGIGLARRRLRALDARLVVGFGGYASVATVLAARTLGVPVVLHEANRLPGRANRLLARFAQRVHTAVPVPDGYFPADRTRVTGQPVRSEIAALAELARNPPQASGPLRVLVTGGSLGSGFLDSRVPQMLSALQRRGVRLNVSHQVGRGEPATVQDHYAALGIPARCSAFVDDMAGAYRDADFAITCAGVNTVAELAMAGLPALLIPLAAAADDHQTANAHWMQAVAGALVAGEADWDDERVAGWIHHIVVDPARWRDRSAAMRRLAAPGAVDALVDACMGIAAVGR